MRCSRKSGSKKRPREGCIIGRQGWGERGISKYKRKRVARQRASRLAMRRAVKVLPTWMEHPCRVYVAGKTRTLSRAGSLDTAARSGVSRQLPDA